MQKLIKRIKRKAWFLFDLPYFIKENNLTNGLELGVKGGRSMYFMLRVNKQLQLTGIDLWENIEGKAYKFNRQNEERCKRKLKPFRNRTVLIKGDAKMISKDISDEKFDFIFYDLQCKLMSEFHGDVLSKWIPKIKKGGFLIGRDFRDFREAFYKLGYKDKDFKKCKIKNRYSERLEYLIMN